MVKNSDILEGMSYRFFGWAGPPESCCQKCGALLDLSRKHKCDLTYYKWINKKVNRANRKMKIYLFILRLYIVKIKVKKWLMKIYDMIVKEKR